jgi:hypothetical protein
MLAYKNEFLLDNPMWSSLTTDHAHLALGAQVGHGLGRRYPAEIGPLSAFQEPTTEAYADLALLIPEGDVAAMFLHQKAVLPEGGNFCAMARSCR